MDYIEGIILYGEFGGRLRRVLWRSRDDTGGMTGWRVDDNAMG